VDDAGMLRGQKLGDRPMNMRPLPFESGAKPAAKTFLMAMPECTKLTVKHDYEKMGVKQVETTFLTHTRKGDVS